MDGLPPAPPLMLADPLTVPEPLGLPAPVALLLEPDDELRALPPPSLSAQPDNASTIDAAITPIGIFFNMSAPLKGFFRSPSRVQREKRQPLGTGNTPERSRALRPGLLARFVPATGTAKSGPNRKIPATLPEALPEKA